jgi:hypothetical protein
MNRQVNSNHFTLFAKVVDAQALVLASNRFPAAPKVGFSWKILFVTVCHPIAPRSHVPVAHGIPDQRSSKHVNYVKAIP